MTFLKYLDIPPIWTVISIGLVFFFNDWMPIYNLSAWISPIAIAVPFAIAFAYIALSIREFRKYKTTIEPKKKATHLITTSVFKISRNPIYTAFALFVFGFALWQGAISGLFAVPFLVWVLQKRFIDKEEVFLLKTFENAREYFDQTRRW